MAIGYGGVFIVQPPYLLFYPDRDHDDIPTVTGGLLLSGFWSRGRRSAITDRGRRLLGARHGNGSHSRLEFNRHLALPSLSLNNTSGQPSGMSHDRDPDKKQVRG